MIELLMTGRGGEAAGAGDGQGLPQDAGGAVDATKGIVAMADEEEKYDWPDLGAQGFQPLEAQVPHQVGPRVQVHYLHECFLSGSSCDGALEG